MACHHGVEGPCLVCERVAFKKANPAPVQVILLHLQSDKGDSLCGLPPQDCLFSNLYAHDEERFCRHCLRAQRRIESREAARRRKAWRVLPWAERMRRTYGGIFRPANIYAMGAFMIAAVVVMFLASVGMVWIAYRTVGPWYAVLTAFLLVLFFLNGPEPPRRDRL